MLSYEAHERSERHNEMHEEVTLLENRRSDCERTGRPFAQAGELERLSQRYESEAESMGKLLNDIQATYYLISRSLEILKQADGEGCPTGRRRRYQRRGNCPYGNAV